MVRSETRAPNTAAIPDLVLRRRALRPGATSDDLKAYAVSLSAAVGVLPGGKGPLELLVDVGTVQELAAHAWDMYGDGATWPALSLHSPVTFTRLIQPDPGAPPCPPAPIEPLNVLFVIASGMEADRVQPVEEYLGLIRNAGAHGLGVQLSLLRDPSPADLRNAILSRTPHVVHFVAHGRLGGRIALGGDLDAAALAAALMPDENTAPWLVVLNACYTAGPGEASEPLAAGLVRRGVPAVIAMGDAIDNAAARTFAWRLYEALADRQPLPLALARGRLAIVAEGFSPPARVEWARPALFRRPDTPLTLQVNALSVRRANAIASLRGDTTPRVLGDRHWLFGEPLRRLTAPGEQPIVLLHTPRECAAPAKLGRTRLLRELGTALIRDGHLVVLVKQPGQGSEITTLADVALAFDDAVCEARTHYGLSSDTGVLGGLGSLMMGEQPEPKVPFDVHDSLKKKRQVRALALALQHDLDSFSQAATKEGLVDSKARRVLLIDELGPYGSQAEGIVELLLGRYVGTPLSVAIAIGPATGQAGSEAPERAINRLLQPAGQGHIFSYPVEMLAAGEGRSALIHWLLGNCSPDGKQAPLWPNPTHSPSEQENTLLQLVEELKGCPGCAPDLQRSFRMLVKYQILVPAPASVQVDLAAPSAAGVQATTGGPNVQQP